MLVRFRCPPHLKKQADALIESGKYQDFAALCLVALENQLVLEQEAVDASISSKRAVDRKPGRRKSNHSEARRRDLRAKESSAGDESVVRTVENIRSGIPGTSPSSLSIPPEFDLGRVLEDPLFALPSAIPDIFRHDQEVPIERWLFGLYNRILPAKVSLRALAVLTTEGKEAMALEVVAPRIAENAAELGVYLRSLDRAFASHRDNALATAFPEMSAEGQKSRVRYQNHFVGHTVKGEQGGFLVGLKLAVIHVIKNKPHILPTDSGWNFARIHNPLLDGPAKEPVTRLGTEEIKFMLKHIRNHVPIELYAYRVTLSLIASGANTPETLNRALMRWVGDGKSLDNEENFVSTQRGGVLGRMMDLQLVRRKREGRKIFYDVSPEGQNFLEEAGAINVEL